MKPLPAQEATKKLNLLEQYIAEHGLPPRVELHSDDIPRLTEEEQRATIEICEAIAAGDEEAGKRLNELWEEIWDRLDVIDANAALAESDERIPYEQIRKELGLE